MLLISIIAGKTSFRFGVPTLLLFLGIGMLAGSDGIGGIYFNDARLAQFIGIISLNFILFSGGLDTDWNTVKPVLKQGLALSTAGVLITAMTLGVFVWYITDFTIYESLLLGSIVSSTDAAAVFSILRSKSLALKNNLRPTLELESGSNDPMAYVLTIVFLSLVINQDQSIWSMIPVFFSQMILGAILGFGFGYLSKLIINRIQLDFEGLYPVLVIGLMFLTFSVTDFIKGNGFLAIYICAVYLGNQELIHKKSIVKMFDGLAWLVQIVLFLTLGLLVFPSKIPDIMVTGILISIFLIIVARPLSVFISLLPFSLKMKSRYYISWVGLRGAVPIVFATYPLLAGIEKAEDIFHIVFFISVSSVLIQGTTLSMVAKWLKVDLPEKVKPLTQTERFLREIPKGAIKEVVVTDGHAMTDKKVVELNFPKSMVIAFIERQGKFFIPDGSTRIKPEDKLLIMAENQSEIDAVCQALSLKIIS